jgi:anaerobic C4-dicarboxylate transporter
MLWLELVIFLAILVMTALIGGIGIGNVAGLGLIVFVFKMLQGSSPDLVLGMILSVVTVLASMETIGGLNLLVSVTKISGKSGIYPKRPKTTIVIAAQHGSTASLLSAVLITYPV